MSRCFSLILVLLLVASGTLTVESASAQSIPKPSVPDFTLAYVDNSYDLPPTAVSSTDPYTGKTTTSTVPGSLVENKSVRVTITNQPFITYKDENGSSVELYFEILFKGHFEDTWQGVQDSPYHSYNLYSSNDPATVRSIPLYNISSGGEVDVKVRALIGKFVEVYEAPVLPLMGTTGIHYVFTGEASDWSSTQTLTIDSDSQNSTFGWHWLGYAAVGVIVAVVVALLWRSRRLPAK